MITNTIQKKLKDVGIKVDSNINPTDILHLLEKYHYYIGIIPYQNDYHYYIYYNHLLVYKSICQYEGFNITLESAIYTTCEIMEKDLNISNDLSLNFDTIVKFNEIIDNYERVNIVIEESEIFYEVNFYKDNELDYTNENYTTSITKAIKEIVELYKAYKNE
ncbi:MAG TPA: hypothetical protein VKN74_02750 [Candidatus Mcinerneyibacterium sp.]|nr:hypothetical protein [Candidatus Mcinerneyibacterium sp.]